MSIGRVALIFDDTKRPETTGGYCLRALAQLVGVQHFRPGQLGEIRAGSSTSTFGSMTACATRSRGP